MIWFAVRFTSNCHYSRVSEHFGRIHAEARECSYFRLKTACAVLNGTDAIQNTTYCDEFFVERPLHETNLVVLLDNPDLGRCLNPKPSERNYMICRGNQDMTKKFSKTIIALAFSWPLASHAGGIYLYELGTSDLGFAAAGTAARAEDASTVYANPAGMTRLPGNQLTVGAQALYGNAEYRLNPSSRLSGSNPGNVIGWAPGGSLFYSHSIDDRLKLGVAVYSNYGLGEKFGSSWAGRNVVDQTALVAATIQPTIAYRVNDKWSLGAGLQANYGYVMLQRVQAVGVVAAGTKRKQTDSDWAYSGRLGVLYEPSKSTRVGLVYNSQADLNFNVNTAVTLPDPVSGMPRTHSLPFGADTYMPQQVMGSVYQRLSDRWAMMGNIGWQNWSKFGDNTVELGGRTAPEKIGYQDTWHIAYGMQYTLSEQTKINTGFAYDTSMYKNQHNTSFVIPNADTWRFGAGVQHALSAKSDIGFAAEYVTSGSSSDPSTVIGGKYDNPYIIFMSANYTYRF